MEPKDRQTPPDARARHRAFVLEHVVNGGLTIAQAAAILKLSTRQMDRLLARHAAGPAALVHGNRGRPPASRLDDARRVQLVELVEQLDHFPDALRGHEGAADQVHDAGIQVVRPHASSTAVRLTAVLAV